LLRRVVWGRQIVCALLGVLTCGLAAQANPVEVAGELEYRMHYLTETNITAISELGYQISLDGSGSGESTYHLSFKGNAAYRPNATDTSALHEAYIDAYLASLDLRVGRQVISWGTADGINPTNYLNPQGPPSLTEMKLSATPVPAVTAAYYHPSGAAITGVAVLDFVPGQVPAELVLPVPIAGGPTGDGDQLEFAVRGEVPLGGFPVYLTYFNGWEDLPVAWLRPVAPPPAPPMPQAKYRRTQALGLATATTWKDAALWLEGAYKIPAQVDELEQAPNIPLSLNDSSFQAVVGADYTFGNGLYASAQVVYNQSGSILSPYHRPGEKPAPQTYVVLRQRYVPEGHHTLELTGLINATDRGVILAPQYSYALAEAVQLQLGAAVVTGQSGSEFAAVKPQVQGLTAGIKLAF
jgi:hypothetical protein